MINMLKKKSPMPPWTDGLFLKWDECPAVSIRQSGLSVFRSCSYKYKITSERRERDNSIPAFIGTIIHFGVDDKYINPQDWLRRASQTEYWFEIMENHKAEQPEGLDIRALAYAFARDDVLKGISIAKIIDTFHQFTNAIGLEFRHSELRIDINYPGYVPYTGTIDLVFAFKGKILLVDTKTSGISNPFRGKGAPSKQSWSKEQLGFMPQLRHYHWMVHRAGLIDPKDVSGYGIFTPSNMCPRLREPNKGSMKGEALFFSEQGFVTEHLNASYERALKSWIARIKRGDFYPEFPSVFGKVECANCFVRDACFGSRITQDAPAHLVAAAKGMDK